MVLIFLVAPQIRAQNITIQSGSGIAVGGPKNGRRSSFGAVNGLGIGTVAAGVNSPPLSMAGGVLYTSSINLQIAGAGNGNPAVVGVFVSANFANFPQLKAFSCSSGCNSAANYTAISLISPGTLASDTTVISPGLTTNQTVPVSIGIFVSNQDAPGIPGGAMSVTDSVQITYQTFNGVTKQLTDTDTFTLNNPNETWTTALQLTLSPSTPPNPLNVVCNGSSPSCTGTPNFTADFGAVDGLGISSGNGAMPIPATNGTIYCATYNINPEFSGFSSSTATVTVALTSPFGNTAGVLQLKDSSASSCASATSSSFTQITNTGVTISGLGAKSFTSPPRLLGLFVSSDPTTTNGPGAFTGSDMATLTFTMTVP